MEVFRANERGYFDWIEANPNGFVLNARRNPNANYLVLHQASCQHIGGHPKKYAHNAFTGRDFIKICSKDADEIKAWVRSIDVRQFSSICQDCQPVADLSVEEPIITPVPSPDIARIKRAKPI